MDKIKKVFQNDRFAARADIELLSVELGRARSKLTLLPYHLNAWGTVQGGAIFTLADFTFAVAANSHGTVAVAVNVSITFMQAVTAGTLFAEARELSKNFKLGTYTVEVTNELGELVAVFQGLAYRKKDKIIP